MALLDFLEGEELLHISLNIRLKFLLAFAAPGSTGGLRSRDRQLPVHQVNPRS